MCVHAHNCKNYFAIADPVARPLAHGRTCIFTLRAFVKSEHRDTLG